MRRIHPGEARSSLLSRGRCYVYVLPCAYEDILKLGFSRDPVARMLTLNPRYFEFFDLDQAFLIETETVRDARQLELALGMEIALHNAPAPLLIRRPAGGHTEWYRGAYPALQRAACALSEAGYVLHRPMRPWLRQVLVARGDLLYDWSNGMFQDIQALHEDPATAVLRRNLLDTLDAFASLGVEVEPLLPPQVAQWYREQKGSW